MNEENQILSAPAPPAASQSNPIVLVLVGVVIVLAIVLMFDMRDGSFSSGYHMNSGPVSAERGGYSSGQSVEDLASRITSDSAALASLAIDLQGLVATKENQIGGTMTLLSSATSEVEQLRKQLAAASLESSETAALRTELNNTRSLLDAANRRTEALQLQLAESPDDATLIAMQRSADEAAQMRDQSTQKLRELENRMMGMISLEEFSAVNDELTAAKEKLLQLKPENDKLHYEIQSLRSELNKTRLFVEKVDDLPAAAKMLYVELSKLDSVSPDQLQAQYDRIKQELNVDIVDTISFETGKSQINLDKVEEIRQAAQRAPENSYFLVVGYASKTGSFDSNKELSAARATTIASVTDVNKKPSQGVQAVFLGQTGRFSSSDVVKNQICEIWEIHE